MIERLTKQLANGFYELKEENLIYGEENGIRLVQILGQLEDSKEELGISLNLLLKALTDGIYYKFSKDEKIQKMKVPMLRVINGEYCWICPKWMTTTWMNVKVKDYGITWALTEEELAK